MHAPMRNHLECFQQHEIGTFRGYSILSRQLQGYIDDNGVPVPYLPYAGEVSEIAEHQRHPMKRTQETRNE